MSFNIELLTFLYYIVPKVSYCCCCFQNMLFVEIPEYRNKHIRVPVKVNFYVINGKRKKSQPQHFTYHPGNYFFYGKGLVAQTFVGTQNYWLWQLNSNTIYPRAIQYSTWMGNHREYHGCRAEKIENCLER